MKVMKFGGTSVGSVNSILNLKNIVETTAREENVIVVVSALGSITDRLIKTAELAVNGNEMFKEEFQQIVAKHHELIYSVIEEDKRPALLQDIDKLLNELDNIYHGLALINNITPKSEATIVSYGERLSSRIVTALIDGAVRYNARKFIKTEVKHGKNILANEVSDRLIHEVFDNSDDKIIIVPGFISQDK